MNLALAILLFLLVFVSTVDARKVSVGVPVLDVTMSPLFIAKDRGYFQKEGLEVDLVLMRGGVSNQALIAGGVEFSAVPTAGLQAALQGAPLKVIFSAYLKPIFWLYARPEVRNVKDLTGKKVAVSSLGAAGDAALRELFKKNGMDENRDVAILAIGTTATRLSALSSNVVDAAMMTSRTISPPRSRAFASWCHSSRRISFSFKAPSWRAISCCKTILSWLINSCARRSKGSFHTRPIAAARCRCWRGM